MNPEEAQADLLEREVEKDEIPGPQGMVLSDFILDDDEGLMPELPPIPER